MKNKIKVFGFIALVVVIGFSFTACGSDDSGGGGGSGSGGGKLTITNLPTQFNGKYIYGATVGMPLANNSGIIADADVDVSVYATPVQIKGGTVVLELTFIGNFDRYDGNDANVPFYFMILNSAVLSDTFGTAQNVSISFKGGSGTLDGSKVNWQYQ